MSNEDDKKRAEEDKQKNDAAREAGAYGLGMFIGWAIHEINEWNKRKKAREEDSDSK